MQISYKQNLKIKKMLKLTMLISYDRLKVGFTEKYIMSRLVSHLIFINIEISNKYGAFTFYYQNGIN